jgi:hypothetical protein
LWGLSRGFSKLFEKVLSAELVGYYSVDKTSSASFPEPTWVSSLPLDTIDYTTGCLICQGVFEISFNDFFKSHAHSLWVLPLLSP